MNFMKTAIATFVMATALVGVSSAAYAQNFGSGFVGGIESDFDLDSGFVGGIENDFEHDWDFGSNYGDPCQGNIEGTWGYKGGRQMSITLIRSGRRSVIVNVSQRNGAESLSGVCREDRHNGSARVEFTGGANSGNLFIDRHGNVRGIVAGFSFRGRKD